MPNSTERRIWIMKLVHRRKRITMAELNRQFSIDFDGEGRIAPTTFKRDLFEIGRAYSIFIEGVKQRQDSYYQMLNPEDFDEGSITRLLVDRISNTLQVNKVIKKTKELGHFDFGERIQLEACPSGEDYLSSILNAMKDNAVIRFSYQGFWDYEDELVLLHPYFVKLAHRRWYVIGWRADNKEIGCFCLDRIIKFAQTTERFVFPADFDVKSYFQHSYGTLIEKDIKVEYVKIKVWGEQVKYLRSLPIHHSQKEITTTPDFSIFLFYLRPTYDLKMEILSHGSSWEVLEPLWFRTDIATGFQMGYRLYFVDEQENTTKECNEMRVLLKGIKLYLREYGKSNIELVDDIANPREPQVGLIVNNQYYIVLGYNDLDKLYYGIRIEDESCAAELRLRFDSIGLKDKLELSAKGWYGWHQTTAQDAFREYIEIIALNQFY